MVAINGVRVVCGVALLALLLEIDSSAVASGGPGGQRPRPVHGPAGAPTPTVLAGSSVAPQAQPDSSAPPSPAAASLAVGALFADGQHFCTASVVDSPAGNLVLTAAHCVDDGSGAGTRDGLTFVPGYHNGDVPLGVWTVTSINVPAAWSSSSDQDSDFAFLTVAQTGNPTPVQDLTGANTLGIDRGFTNDVVLTGYPNTSDEPVVCQGDTSQGDTAQLEVACPGFPDGTSGSPWVTDVDPGTGNGTVIGEIGGYERGGDDPNVSYSPYFGADIERLYESATAP